MANTQPDDTPGNWFIVRSRFGRFSLWHALDDGADEKVIGSDGLSQHLDPDNRFVKGAWHVDARFTNITEDQAAAGISAFQLAGDDAWQTYARNLFDA